MTLPTVAGILALVILLYRATTRWALTLPLALAQIVVAFAICGPLAYAIDQGLYSRLAPGMRVLPPAALAFGLAAGFEGFSGLLDRLVSMRPVRATLAPYKWAALALIVGCVAIGLHKGFGLSPLRTLIVASGTLYCLTAIRRPPWFWEHSAAHALRQRLGDRGAATMYVLLGAVAVAYGVLGPLPQ